MVGPRQMMANQMKLLRNLWARSRFMKDVMAYHSFPLVKTERIKLIGVPERWVSR